MPMHICVTWPQWVNTLRQSQNDQHFPDDIFKCIFLNENISIPIQVSLKFVLLRDKLAIFHHWFGWGLGAVQATSHYLNQWRLVYRRIYASLSLNELREDYKRLYIYIYINCPTRTNKSKSLITLDNKKSPGAARFPVMQLEIYYCFYSYLAWYATVKTTEGNKNLMAGLPIKPQDFTPTCKLTTFLCQELWGCLLLSAQRGDWRPHVTMHTPWRHNGNRM